MPGINQEIDQSDYDRCLVRREAEAFKKYERALLNLDQAALADWFVSLLNTRIVPGLMRVGFAEPFCRSIFEIASSAWGRMRPTGKGTIRFFPLFIRDLEEVKKGILFQSSRLCQKEMFLFHTPAKALPLLVNKMFPENILSVADDICLSWIILPRVFNHLEISHWQYLPGYLKYLNNAPAEDFKRVLACIVVEFIGNYTFKFRDDIFAADQVINALFYGYEAMFWKNLRNPPAGLEGTPIFEYFLSWARRFQNRFAAGHTQKINALKKMEHEKVKAFPSPNAFGLAPYARNDMDALVTSLRHGRLGIESAVRFFGLGKGLLKNKTDGLLPYLEVPTALSAFFRKIQKRFKTESLTTQRFIRTFLSELCASYEFNHAARFNVDKEIQDQLRFIAPRIVNMTNHLVRVLEP